MPAITYKCPNCSGDLQFDPATQNFKCGYCRSAFTKNQIESPAAAAQPEPAVQAEAAPPRDGNVRPDGTVSHTAVYNCPTCGAEIVTDDTTAATFCYYCHNPVVLSGRLSGNFLPDAVIPFTIPRDKAVDEFMAWVGAKKFVPKSFFSEDQIAKLSGVYFPYWMIDGDVTASLNGTATRVRVWRSGNTEYTETKRYQIRRAGRFVIRDIPKTGINKENQELVDGVHPFQTEAAQAFTPAYLSGFLAEKRNLEKEHYVRTVQNEITKYTDDAFKSTVGGYTTVRVSTSINNMKTNWKYTLLPVWVLTYGIHGGKVHYYALNGQTGKVRGVLPLNYRKLGLVSGLIALGVFVVMCLGGLLF